MKKFVATATSRTITMSEIEKAIEAIDSLPKQAIKVKMNGKWLKEQINKGFIREEDFKPDGRNYFTGVPVEITDEVERYEFVYES